MTDNATRSVQTVEPAWKRQYVVIIACALLIIALLGALGLYSYAVSQGPVHGSSELRVYIPPGSSVREIRNILSESGVIGDDIRFVILTRVLGDAKKLQAGEYLFPPGRTPLQIIKDLAAGKTVLRSITVAEGLTVRQMADIFAEQGWSEKEPFLALAQSKNFIRSLGVKADNLEGYLFPDTYFFPKGENIREIVGAMVRKGRQVMREECRNGVGGFFFACSGDDLSTKADKAIAEQKGIARTLSTHQIWTLASIIEKETALENERPMVARVFLNRLAANMKLQADPTLIYGLQKHGESLTKDDLGTPGLYNTYRNKGLPPGPICSPGRSSLRAVFNPSEDLNYYFVSRNDGSHSFSKSLKEHNKAVKRYRELVRQKESSKL